ncbi:tRNA-uridine aminocarboxypropyltransferase [Pseudoalteromonas mariniglutinosa]|uniref:tRNA-uridine aminocarboxypropyltransferase n=1 Tax=Pseudoalteromonas mariniglutinosa TaxID=206042 RepID=UPI00384BA87B
MARQQCNHCGFSLKTCLCDAISIVNNRIKIIILRHPSEQKNSKNTAHLLTLGLKSYALYNGESTHDFAVIDTLPIATTALLYPDEQAMLLDNDAIQTDFSKAPLTHLVVIDGTWKKAYKIRQLTPSLANFRCLSFAQLPENKYSIRKAPRADSLSTLEAVAHSLYLLEQADVQPLYTLLAALVDKQTSYMPSNVKARYQ